MRLRSSAGLALLLLTGCFEAPGCTLDFDDCKNDFDCADDEVCVQTDFDLGLSCELRRLCSNGCLAGTTCVQRPGITAGNPFESDVAGKRVCECATASCSGAGGFGGGGSGGFGGSGGSGGAGTCKLPDPEGAPLDVLVLGGTESETGAIIDPTGATMAFSFRGELGNDGSIVSAGEADVEIVGYDDAGQPAWGRTLGNESSNVPTAIARSGGTVAVATGFTGDIDVGTGPLASGAGAAALITALDAKGFTEAALVIRSDIDVTVSALAFAGADQIFVGGTFSGKLDLAGTKIEGSGGSDGFTASFKFPQMALLWVHQLGGPGDQSVTALAADPAANVYVAGAFDGPMTLDDTWVGTADGVDGFVQRIGDGLKEADWVALLGGPDRQVATALAVTPDLGVVVAGARGSMTPEPGYVDLGNGTVLDGSGVVDGFVAKLDKGGTVEWGSLLAGAAGTGEVTPRAVAVDCAGGITVVGAATDGASLGGEPLASAGGNDAFAVRMDGTGYALWFHLWGGAGDDVATGVGFRKNRLIVGGSMTGEAAFGLFAAQSAGAEDAFVLEVSP